MIARAKSKTLSVILPEFITFAVNTNSGMAMRMYAFVMP